MCGLYGYSGAKRPDRAKLVILGMWNQIRGTDSCGVFSNNTLIRSAEGAEKKFSNWAVKNEIPIGKNNFSVIGHVRNASVGKINESSAHPYPYVNQDNQDEILMAFAHNGTVKNWVELVKREGLDPNVYFTDSHALGHMAAQQKFDWLKDFEGAVTFIATRTERPNSMIIFKGQTYDDYPDRPLFGLQGPNYMYVSSMVEPLLTIKSSTKEKIINFETNKLIYINEGVITNVVDIDRKLVKRPKKEDKNAFTGSSVGKKIAGFLGYSAGNPDDMESSSGPAVNPGEGNINHGKYTDKGTYGGAVYWSNGRYWRNGHLLSGQYSLAEDGTLDEKEGTTYYFYRGIMLNAFDGQQYGAIADLMDEIFDKEGKVKESDVSYGLRTHIAAMSVEPFDFLYEEREEIEVVGHCIQKDGYMSGTLHTMFANPKRIMYRAGTVVSITDINEMNKAQERMEERKKNLPSGLSVVRDRLEGMPDTYWTSLNWDELDYDSMHPSIADVYFQKAKEFKPEIEELEKVKAEIIGDISNDLTADIISELMDSLEDAEYQMNQKNLNTPVAELFVNWLSRARKDLAFLEINARAESDVELADAED